jgi:hypothetical protein
MNAIPKNAPQPDNKLERGWSNGPLRIIGSSNGSLSRYVCEGCRYISAGLYQTSKGWLCAGCSEGVPKVEVRPSRNPAVARSVQDEQPRLAFAT